MRTYEINPYPLRLEPSLRSALEKLAKKNNRSLHAEIIALLEHCVAASDDNFDIRRVEEAKALFYVMATECRAEFDELSQYYEQATALKERVDQQRMAKKSTQDT